MSVQTFKASHCGETYTGEAGAAAFVAHMKEAHKVTRPPTASWARPTPAWVNPNPIPWEAPKRQPGGIERVAEKIAAGAYQWPATWRTPASSAGEVAA